MKAPDNRVSRPETPLAVTRGRSTQKRVLLGQKVGEAVLELGGHDHGLEVVADVDGGDLPDVHVLELDLGLAGLRAPRRS